MSLVRILATFLALFIAVPDAAAQEQQFRFELTPYLGYRLGGSFEEQDGDRQFDLDFSKIIQVEF